MYRQFAPPQVANQITTQHELRCIDTADANVLRRSFQQPSRIRTFLRKHERPRIRLRCDFLFEPPKKRWVYTVVIVQYPDPSIADTGERRVNVARHISPPITRMRGTVRMDDVMPDIQVVAFGCVQAVEYAR
jgi:hypothetical protein